MELLTVREASQSLGVSISTVWRLIKRGALRSVRRNGRRLIPEDALLNRTAISDRDEIPPLTEDHPIFRPVGTQ